MTCTFCYDHGVLQATGHGGELVPAECPECGSDKLRTQPNVKGYVTLTSADCPECGVTIAEQNNVITEQNGDLFQNSGKCSTQCRLQGVMV